MSAIGWLQTWPPELAVDERAWLQALIADGPQKLIANVTTDMRLLRWRDQVLPVTVNHKEYASSYVCSPYNAFVAYARDELHKLPNALARFALSRVIDVLGMILRFGQINRNVHVNNWLLSTNLYPQLSDDFARELLTFLLAEFPDHAFVLRSLTRRLNGPLLDQLQRAGFELLPTRQVYLFERADAYLKKQNTRWDLALLARTPYAICDHESLRQEEVPRMVELYRLLYLEKYSRHNPQFTEAFLSHCLQHHLLTMTGLRDRDGRLQAVVGWFARNGVATVPLVGYNTALPQKHGLYRMLIALCLRDVAARGLLLNLSAGAAHFKRLRGGRAELEYAAVYNRHLAPTRRAIMFALRVFLDKVAAPMLARYEL